MDNSPSNNVENNLDDQTKDLEPSDLSTDTGSDISLSEKIVLESNEKRLRQRMTSLQNSIMNLKTQLSLEKELWREDIEKIRTLQQQQQEMKCTCARKTGSKESLKYEILSKISSNCSMGSGEGNSRRFEDVLRNYSIKQLLDLQNYKRKLAETETMCNMELVKVKQSLDDLKALQSIATEWGRQEEKEKIVAIGDTKSIEEIFINESQKISKPL